MSETTPATPRMGFPTEPVPFHYIKANDFRVVHVDGAIGSVTPRGLIHAALYSERLPIPWMSTHRIKPDGQLGPPEAQDIRSGLVREVEVSLMLDRGTAESLRNWLTEQISVLDNAFAAAATADAAKAGDSSR
jgi:hypothetical protein